MKKFDTCYTPSAFHLAAPLGIATMLLLLPANGESSAEPGPHATVKSESGLKEKCATVSAEQRASAEKLLTAIENDPGFFSQMCSLRFVNTTTLPLFAFERGERRISTENFRKIREMRTAFLCVIDERLRRLVELQRSSTPASSQTSGPSEITPNQLVILIDLNGTELLESLVEYYRVYAASNTELEKGPSHRSQRYSLSVAGAESHAVQKQIELLVTIAALLRQEGLSSLLESDLEKKFCEAVKAQAARYRDSTNPPQANRQNDWYTFDRHCREMIRFEPYTTVPLSNELRGRIIRWARDFCDRTPPEKRLAEKGMSPWPVTR